MNRKRTFTAPIILASILGLFAVPVLAAHPDCGPRGAEHRAEYMEQNHQKLHDTLKLNPGQDIAWKKMLVSERTMHIPNRTDREDWAKLTTPERGEKRLQHMKAEQALVADHVAALNEFYSLLTPEQKLVFDEFHAAPRNGLHGRSTFRSAKEAKPVSAK